MGLFTSQINTLLALEAWTTTPGTVAAPVLAQPTLTSSTAALSWTGANGTYTLQRALVDANGTPGTYAPLSPGPGTAKNYSDGPLSFGATYAWRVKVTVGGVDSPFSNVVAASTTAPVSDTVMLTSANFSGNAYENLPGGSGSYTYQKRSSMDYATIPTDATQFELTVAVPVLQTPFGSPAGAIFSIFNDSGVFVGSVQAANVAGPQTLTTPVLPASARYRFVEGGNSQTSDTTFEGAYYLSIKRLNGTTISVVAPTPPQNLAVFYGDSILQGFNSTNNSRYGWPVVLRGALGASWGVTAMGWGALYAGGALATPELRQAAANQTAFALAGVTGQKVLVIVAGTNDFKYKPTAPAVAAGNLAAYADLVVAQVPGVKIIMASPLWRSDQAVANSLGFVLADYTATMFAQADNRGWDKVDRSAWHPSSDFYEPGASDPLVHLNDTGHATEAQYWSGILNTTPLYNFSDDFERADGTVGNGWLNQAAATIISGKLRIVQDLNLLQPLLGRPNVLSNTRLTTLTASIIWKNDGVSVYGFFVRQSAGSMGWVYLQDRGGGAFSFLIYSVSGYGTPSIAVQQVAALASQKTLASGQRYSLFCDLQAGANGSIGAGVVDTMGATVDSLVASASTLPTSGTCGLIGTTQTSTYTPVEYLDFTASQSV